MPKINHPIEQEELMAYLDGELPPDRAGAAAGHLERCRECQGLAADLQSVSRRMLEWQVEPAVFALPQNEALAKPTRKRRLARWAWGLATASAFAVAVFVALAKMNSPRALPLSQQATQRYEQLSEFSRLEKRPEATGNQTYMSSVMIARTAQLALTTQEFDHARAALEEILKRHNGYLGQLNVSAPSGSGRTLDATL